MVKRTVTYVVGKAAVKMHYRGWFDLYSLASVHEPELYLKSQRKAKIPTSTRWTVWRRDHFTCVYCHAYGMHLTLDHKVPEDQGGTFDAENLLTACSSCNQKKGNKSYEEFLKSPWLKKKRKHSPYPRLWTTQGPVRAENIASQAVTAEKLRAGTVTTSKLTGSG